MESTKLLRSISDPKDAGHHVRPISRPNSIATDITNRTAQRTPNRRNDAQSPSSCASMSSSTPSGEGSSSQSEYFSYEADDLGSLKTATKPARTFEEWKPTLGTNYEILQSLKVGEKFDEQVPVFEGFLSKKRRRRGTGFQKRFCRLDEGYLLYAKSRIEMEKGILLDKLDIGLSVVVLNAKKRGIEIDSTEALHHFRAYTEVQFLKWAQMLRDHRLYRQATMAHLAFNDADLDGTLKDGTLLNQPSVGGRRIGLDVSKAQLDAIFTKLDRAAALVEQWEMAASEPVSERELMNAAAENGSRKTTIRRFFTRRKKADKKDEMTTSSGSSKGSTVARTPTMDALHIPPPSSVVSDVPPLVASPIPSTGGTGTDISHGSESSLNKLADVHPNLMTIPPPSRLDMDTLLLARDLVSTFRVIGNDFRQLYNRFNTALSDDGTLKGSVIQARIVHTLSSDSAGTIGSGDTFFTAISHFSASAGQRNAPLMSDTSSDRGDSHDEGCSSDSEVDDAGEEEEILLKHTDIQCQTGRRTTLPSPRPPADGSLLKMIGGFIGKDLTRLALPVKINEPLSMLQRLCEELEYCELLDRAADCADPVERMTMVATFAISGFASSYYRASTKPFNPLLGETYECEREDKGFRFVGEQVSHHPPISACHAESLNDKYCYWQDFRPKTRFWGRSIEITNHGEVHVTINKSEHYRWNKPSSRVGIAALMSQKGNLEIYGTIKITCSNGYYATLTFGKSSSEGTPTHVEGSVHGPDRSPLTALFGSWNECVYWSDPGRIGSNKSAGTKVLWRAGGMPADHETYYGFTRFAIELNEVTDEMSKVLPVTDCRFRPDQRFESACSPEERETFFSNICCGTHRCVPRRRLLEKWVQMARNMMIALKEQTRYTRRLNLQFRVSRSRSVRYKWLLECGNILSAEIEKKRVEQAQRERSSKYTKDHYPYEPRWFRRVEQGAGNDLPDIYEFTYRYWSLRENPGFERLVPPIEELW